MDVRHSGQGVDNRGFLVMDVHVNGKIPSFPEQHVIAMDPYVEYLVQAGPGRLQGFGSSTYRVGSSYSVPYRFVEKLEKFFVYCDCLLCQHLFQLGTQHKLSIARK